MIGPIDYVLLEFPDQTPSGETAAALLELVDAGIIRVYDITAIRKAADGSVSGFEVTDLTGDVAGSLVAFAGARSGLVGDDDIAEVASAMEPGTIAVLLVYENGCTIRHCATAGWRTAHCLRPHPRARHHGFARRTRRERRGSPMPGPLRGVARTAVVAGTATAVSGRVAGRQAERFADRDQAIAANRGQGCAAGAQATYQQARRPHSKPT